MFVSITQHIYILYIHIYTYTYIYIYIYNLYLLIYINIYIYIWRIYIYIYIYIYSLKIMKNFKDLICSANFEYVCFSFICNKDCSIMRYIVNISGCLWFWLLLRTTCFSKCGRLRLFGVESYFFYRQWTVSYQNHFLIFY